MCTNHSYNSKSAPSLDPLLQATLISVPQLKIKRLDAGKIDMVIAMPAYAGIEIAFQISSSVFLFQ